VFEVDAEKKTIFYALAALKGVGTQAVEAIIAARGDKPFKDLADFAHRINSRTVNRRVFESLAASGAFDCIERDRARAFAAVDVMLATAQRSHEATTVGQNELFGGAGVHEPLAIPSSQPWLPAERLQKEYDAIGFFLTGHPLDDYAPLLKGLRVESWSDFCKSVKFGASAGRVAATVVSRQERRTKTGNKMGIIGLSDPTGQYEAVIFSEGLQQYRELLEPGGAVLLFLAAEAQGDDVRARIQTVEPLDKAAAKLQKGLRVFLRDAAPLEAVSKRLEAIPGSANRANSSADGEVNVVLMLNDGAEVEVRLPGRFKVSPQIAGAIKAVAGVVDVQTL
jgi:DNA polymerase-3 subunit alpha